MRPVESFLGQPIRDLQSMLRVIAKAKQESNCLIPDGIYGQKTSRAVAEFQREHDLPATGITDLATWEAVLECYTPARTHLQPACPLHPIFNPNQVIGKGEKHPHLYVIQGILAVLSQQFISVSFPSFSGMLDRETEKSICSFQALCSLPVTGTVDKITWKYLALHYPLAASLQNPLQSGFQGKRPSNL